RAKDLLSSHPGQFTNVAEDDEANAADSGDEEPAPSAAEATPGFQLSFYVEELGDFRVNLERYNRLVGKDPDSLSTLRQLGTYLNHMPIPDSIDKNNYLYKHAIVTAQGRAIDSKVFYK